MTKIYNRLKQKPIRRSLRSSLTNTESILWRQLRYKQLGGHKFRRQFSVGRYVLDFYCPETKLAIELDGDSHFTPEGKRYDMVRTDYLAACGIRVLRFTNLEIKQNLTGVMETIASEIV